jgi:hypothetical protein
MMRVAMHDNPKEATCVGELHPQVLRINVLEASLAFLFPN